MSISSERVIRAGVVAVVVVDVEAYYATYHAQYAGEALICAQVIAAAVASLGSGCVGVACAAATDVGQFYGTLDDPSTQFRRPGPNGT